LFLVRNRQREIRGGEGKTVPPAQIKKRMIRVTYTRCCIDTIDSPDDEHMAARNI